MIAKLFHFRSLIGPWTGQIDSGCSVFIVGRDSSITVGRRFSMARDAEIQSRGVLRIGNHVTINENSKLVCFESIRLGDHCLIANNVAILDHDHAIGPHIAGGRDGYQCAPICIEDNVWIGEKVTILKGVSIGKNSVIGANSVVTKDVPANCIAAGSPARVLKELNHRQV